ncbi:VOC family protein [Chengkuizengella axinellae]|uniref:VOC family protein n=1 Tax=Chengkuizengella axinellae TaxID=3064388 RepID=A0ABT9IV17_9BACL|nr:VOC family protein [Chengkuizengella sp. 2205SS18-9]MDP5272897.1 VOC family protein [Chengkuizengella sp. 2205SS18-9]
MFKKLECAAIYTGEIQKSIDFYKSLGLKQNWKIERDLDNGNIWTMVGLKFPDEKSSELVLQNNPEIKETDIEILVDDVRQTYQDLSPNRDINWIKEPFSTESGHVAVMEAPDKNVFVLVGK